AAAKRGWFTGIDLDCHIVRGDGSESDSMELVRIDLRVRASGNMRGKVFVSRQVSFGQTEFTHHRRTDRGIGGAGIDDSHARNTVDLDWHFQPSVMNPKRFAGAYDQGRRR